MCLKDLRDEFIYDCECRHLAKGSLRNYKAATRFLLEYLELKQITELEDVRPRHIRDLMKEKQDAGSTSRYINDLLKVWRTWFNYLVNEGYLDERDKTIIMLLFDTGMRCNEMILMEPEDIKQDYILVKHGNCSCSASISWAVSLYCSTRFSKMLMLMCVPLFKSLVNGRI